MSRHLANVAVDRLNSAVSLFDPSSINIINRDLRELASADREREEKLFAERLDTICQAYGFRATERDKPFAYNDGVAIIPVHGTLLNRFNWSWGYVTGYNFIRWQLNAALDDDDVTTIVLDVNSPGGEAAGCFELAKEIREARKQKPILAVVDSLSASAAYALSSGATKIYLTPSGRAGSIGVIAMHIDFSKLLADEGIKVTFIFAGKHKKDGNPYEPLPDDVKADIQSSIDKAYGQFVELVATNRSLDSQSIRDTEARVYRADDALAQKLVDAVKTPSEAVAAFLGEIGDDIPTETEDEEMTTTPAAGAAATPAAPAAVAPAAAAGMTAADVAAAVAQGIREDRARSTAITSCEEAKGREALAAHLAASGMGVEEAKGILNASPKAAAPGSQPAPNALAAAMAGTEQPNVGADGEGGAPAGGEQAKDPVAAILGDQATATGRTAPKA